MGKTGTDTDAEALTLKNLAAEPWGKIGKLLQTRKEYTAEAAAEIQASLSEETRNVLQFRITSGLSPGSKKLVMSATGAGMLDLVIIPIEQPLPPRSERY